MFILVSWFNIMDWDVSMYFVWLVERGIGFYD